MDTAATTLIIERIDALQADIQKEFISVHKEVKTEFASVRGDINELAERTSDAFTGMTQQFEGLTDRFDTLETKTTHLETQIATMDSKVDTLIRLDHQHQIDVLRDDMRLVKTKIGLA